MLVFIIHCIWKFDVSGWNRSLENFTYEDYEMADLFMRLLNSTQFEGVSVSGT